MNIICYTSENQFSVLNSYYLDVICSPNSLFMTETIVSSLLRWLYRTLLYPRFISFLYLPRVFHTCTSFSYLDGIILNSFRFSLTSTWLSSHYHMLYLQQLPIMILSLIFLSQLARNLCYHVVLCWCARLTLTLQIICFRTSAPIDSLAYFFLLRSFALLV